MHFLKMINIFIFLLFNQRIFADYPEYLYPIGPIIFEESERICVLYQKGTYLELLLWDPVTKKAIKGLSHQTPAGLMILPCKNAFSFIDHERVRIKSISKKSSKALDLHPLYDFNIVYWIDDENFYCSARERRVYNLFHITRSGNFYQLTDYSTSEYTYPQKIDKNLFYIKKNMQGIISIEKTEYPLKEIELCNKRVCELNLQTCSIESLEMLSCDDEHYKCILKPAEILVSFSEPHKALSFLSMSNEHEGFFLKHVEYPFLERSKKTMDFEYWQLLYENESWITKKLFDFSLPLNFLYGQHRLCEAILRLIPVHIHGDIFYVSTDKEGFLDVYRYEISDTHVTCYTKDSNCPHYFFTPVFYQGNALLGGMITDNDNPEKSPTLTLDIHGAQVITFPFLAALDLAQD